MVESGFGNKQRIGEGTRCNRAPAGGFDVRTFDKETGKTLGFVSVNNKQGVDIYADGTLEKNNFQTPGDVSTNNAGAFKSFFQQVSRDVAKMDGGGCPDGPCDEKDQMGNAGNVISGTAKGVELNSKNLAENYEAKYATKELTKDQITKATRSTMKSTAKRGS